MLLLEHNLNASQTLRVCVFLFVYRECYVLNIAAF